MSEAGAEKRKEEESSMKGGKKRKSQSEEDVAGGEDKASGTPLRRSKRRRKTKTPKSKKTPVSGGKEKKKGKKRKSTADEDEGDAGSSKRKKSKTDAKKEEKLGEEETIDNEEAEKMEFPSVSVDDRLRRIATKYGTSFEDVLTFGNRERSEEVVQNKERPQKIRIHDFGHEISSPSAASGSVGDDDGSKITPQIDAGLQPRNGFADFAQPESEAEAETDEDAALNEIPGSKESILDGTLFSILPFLLLLLKIGPIYLSYVHDEHFLFVLWTCQAIASLFLLQKPTLKLIFTIERALLSLITIYALSFNIFNGLDTHTIACLLCVDLAQQLYVLPSRKNTLYCGQLIFSLGTALMAWRFMCIYTSNDDLSHKDSLIVHFLQSLMN